MNSRLLLFFFATCGALILYGCTGEAGPELQTIESPAGNNSRLPFLTSDASGSAFLSWVEPATQSNTFQLLYAKMQDGGWSTPQSIASDSSWFVNWADFPKIVSEDGSLLAAHALKKIPGGTYAYNVNLFTNQSGRAWSGPFTPHFDSTATEHGFVSLAPWNGNTLAIWLDGRRSHNRSEEEYYDIGKAMTLRSAVIDRQGTINQKKLIDESVCDCCNTDITVTPKGAVAAYRNRTDDEIRDIFISRYAGGEWSQPQAVYNDNWKIGACPVNGPAIAASDSTVVVAWYTAAQGKAKVKAAFSTDYGQRFSQPVIISNGNPLGRVDAVMDPKGTAFVSWMEKNNNRATFNVRGLTASNDSLSSRTITEMNPSRSSGFPQMTLANDRLIFAWTQVDSTTSVQTAACPLAGLDEDSAN